MKTAIISALTSSIYIFIFHCWFVNFDLWLFEKLFQTNECLAWLLMWHGMIYGLPTKFSHTKIIIESLNLDWQFVFLKGASLEQANVIRHVLEISGAKIPVRKCFLSLLARPFPCEVRKLWHNISSTCVHAVCSALGSSLSSLHIVDYFQCEIKLMQN